RAGEARGRAGAVVRSLLAHARAVARCLRVGAAAAHGGEAVHGDPSAVRARLTRQAVRLALVQRHVRAAQPARRLRPQLPRRAPPLPDHPVREPRGGLRAPHRPAGRARCAARRRLPRGLPRRAPRPLARLVPRAADVLARRFRDPRFLVTTTTEYRCRLCGGAEPSVETRGIRDWEYGAPGEYSYLRCVRC